MPCLYLINFEIHIKQFRDYFMLESNFNFKDLKGKTFLLTGSANGIGRCFAKCLANQGANLILLDKDVTNQQTLEKELNNEFYLQKFKMIYCDLSLENERVRVFNETLNAYNKLDGFIHNAGIDPRNPIENSTISFLHKIFAIKLDTAVQGVQMLLPLLQKSDSGRILFIGSVASEIGISNLSAYAAANAAISGLTRSLAHELGELNITVNCINPGAIAVEKNKDFLNTEKSKVVINSQSITRQIYPDDLFGLLCLLLSVSSSFITAQNFTVDGGLMHEMSKKLIQKEITGSN